MNKFKTTSLFIIIVLVLMANNIFAQNTLNTDKQIITKIGRGVNYGGSGLSIELRLKSFGIQAFSGYITPKYLQTITIPNSFNFGLNTFYYLLSKDSPIRPKIGLHFGWLNNYYDSKIGTDNYDAIVYGSAIIPGLEFGEGNITFGLNLILDPGFAILKEKTHPYYKDKFHISGSFGLGIDIIGLNKSMKKYKLNLNFRKNIKKKKARKERVIQEEVIAKSTVQNKCERLANISATISKGICGENVIYQQISSDKFVIIEFNNNISNYSSTNTFFIKSNAYSNVYIVNGTKADEFCSVLNTTKNYVKASEGKIILLVEEHPEITDSYKVSVMLKNIKIQTKIDNETKTQIYDEIIICNLLF